MSGSQQTQQQQQQQTAPWAPAQGALQNAIPQLQGALSQSQVGNAATLPSQFVAGLNPAQLQTFGSMLNYANSNNSPGIETATGQNLTGTGAGATNSALAGLTGFNPYTNNNTQANIAGANQYVQGYNIPAEVQNAMLAANQEAQNVTLPGIDQAAAASGNANSSRAGIASGLVQQGLAEQAANLSGTLQNQAYSNGLNLASNTNTVNNQALLSALQGGGQLGLSTAGAGLGALSQGIGDQSNLFNIANAAGSGLQTGQQQQIQNQLAANQFATQNPYAALSPYLSALGGIGALGSQSSGTNTTTTTPSAYEVIGGLLGAGGSLLGSKPGALSGGSGILGTGWNPFATPTS